MLPSERLNNEVFIDADEYVAAFADEIVTEPDLFSVSEPINPDRVVLPDKTDVVASYDLVPDISRTFLFMLNVPVLKE